MHLWIQTNSKKKDGLFSAGWNNSKQKTPMRSCPHCQVKTLTCHHKEHFVQNCVSPNVLASSPGWNQLMQADTYKPPSDLVNSETATKEWLKGWNGDWWNGTRTDGMACELRGNGIENCGSNKIEKQSQLPSYSKGSLAQLIKTTATLSSIYKQYKLNVVKGDRFTSLAFISSSFYCCWVFVNLTVYT